MPMEIQISCPWHSAVEKVEMPERHQNFDGEVMCNPPEAADSKPVIVKIASFKIVSVTKP